MTRKKLIAANWKMYKTPEQTTAFFAEFLPMVAGHSRDEIVICPPFLDLHAAVEAARGSNVAVGAQNIHWAKEGAFTGEISPAMLTAIQVTHVIIGHSERRQYFNETDDTVNRKLEIALENGLTPIVCVGEVLEEREAGLVAWRVAPRFRDWAQAASRRAALRSGTGALGHPWAQGSLGNSPLQSLPWQSPA